MAGIDGFGQWLAAELGRRGMSPAELARESGLSPTMVSRLLSGERQGREHDTQVRIAQALRMTHAELVAAVEGRPASTSASSGATLRAIESDPDLTAEQKEALAVHYRSYRRA
jgi:transcriptional regulator with XRE-family HTH domain